MSNAQAQEFTGHIYIFHSFDVGDDIDLARIKEERLAEVRPLERSRYFKNYHIPLAAELPHPHATSHCDSVKIDRFGVVTLRYKVPFTATFEQLRTKISEIDNEYREQSVEDASTLFKQIKKAIKGPRFFHTAQSYLMIQVEVAEDLPGQKLRELYGSEIASTLRFESKALSEYKKNEILEKSHGYYRGDLIIIDAAASFVYDKEYEELLDLFEFVNVQHLELLYYDRVLDARLDELYNRESRRLPVKAYFPMWGTMNLDSIADLGNLKVEISVITERLVNNLKLISEPYYSELYSALSETLDLEPLKVSIEKKLDIIHDIDSIKENKITTVREDMFNILISILIFLEFIVAIMHYLKS